MASTVLLLLLVSVASASHHMGGRTGFTYRGRNPDGTYRVDFYNRDAYDRCHSSHSWFCYQGNCGTEQQNSYQRRAIIDNSTNAPSYENLWCETESVQTRHLQSNKPFYMRVSSCCWIQTRNAVGNWKLMTFVDLGTRSDTKEPNRSPDFGILPFLRVPQNCPRTYKLVNFDPDGDKVRCRYGNIPNLECSRCDQPPGFHLNQDTCTLQYNSASLDYRVYGFEMMVEDFPQAHITLSYSDGSQSYRNPLSMRKKRGVYPYWHYTSSTSAPTSTPTTTPAAPAQAVTPNSWHWWWWTTSASTTPAAPAQAVTPNSWHWGWWTTTVSTTPAAPAQAVTPNSWHWGWWTTSASTTPAAPARAVTPNSWHWGWWTTTVSTTPTAPTQPLSKLPLHFSLLVDQPVPSCHPGVYLPKYLSPTPENGAHIHAEVGKEVEIKVKAVSTHSIIDNIIMSGPQNTRKHKNTHNEFVLTFTPTQDDLGNHYVLCFAVEAKTGFRVYQSDMRCVVVDVGKKIVEAKVICTETTMTVEVDKSTFPRLSEDHLRLSDPSNVICSLKTHSNSTHVIAIVPLNACGTQIEEDDEFLKFKNEITTFDNVTDLITRKHLLEVQFYCQYPKRGNVTQSFLAHRKSITVWEKGMGQFTYQFEFYPDAQFGTMIDPNSYPLDYYLGNRIYMQIEATSSVNNTVLFVESCRAAPYDNPNYTPVYSIIENGCKVDQTVDIHSPDHAKQFRMSLEAFKFIGLHDQVYISCSVLMCRAGDPNTRCAQGCINPPQAHSQPHGRRKRGIVTQSSAHLVSQGPLRLRRSAERADSPAMNLNLNLVFIAGCLLAAVGMISGVVLYKARITKVKYQPLSTFES